MDFKGAMRELEAMGTAHNRKVYARHGVRGAMFGVSFAHLGKLQKRIRTDAALAAKLWASGNHDARVLATKVADAASIPSGTLDAWARDLDNTVVADAFALLAARTPHAAAKARKWARSKGEWTGRVGWALVSLEARGAREVPDAVFEARLGEIEAGIHTAKNRVRDAMNGALIAIGLRGGALEKKALAAARRIGRIEVDHGETGCKTPDAAAVILRAKARGRAAGEGPGKSK